MNLSELKKYVDTAIESAKECGESPDEVLVSIQIDNLDGDSYFSTDVELIYDNNCNASGCVLFGED